MKSSNKNAAGPALLPGNCQAQSATQAAWRFLNNPKISLVDLVEPLRQLGRDACQQCESDFVLLAHDWCKLDYKSHTSKRDLRQITHESDIGYELSTSLLINALSGNAIAPLQMHLRAAKRVYSTAEKPPKNASHRLDEIAPTMKESHSWGLSQRIVHVIDREADTLGRMRQWDGDGHLFLVRCDDRRVKWEGQSILISEIEAHFDSEVLFQDVGEALHKGKAVRQEVAEADIVLFRGHSQSVNGEKTTVQGRPLKIRLVVTRLIDDQGYVVAQWTLLTNVLDATVDAHQIARWYYWRWQIESYFKLLKSHGQELEQWQQQSGESIARRILVASMACAVVFNLQGDDSKEGLETRQILVRLSGRQMKYGCISTPPALLAGYMRLLSLIDLLEHTDVDLDQLTRLARDSLPFKLV